MPTQAHVKLRRQVLTDLLTEFPDITNRSLVRLVMERHPDLWPSEGACRGSVERWRGSYGERLTAEKHYNTIQSPEDRKRRKSIERIPEPLQRQEDSEPVYLSPGCALVLSDIHVPYHDKQALETAIERGIDEKCDQVVLNGDLIDFYALSRYETDPRERNLPRELELTGQVIEVLADAFPGAPIYWKLGNHEERWTTYLDLKAPELTGLPMAAIEKNISLRPETLERLQLVDRMRHLILYKLAILHGHEFGRSVFSPVNIARGLFLRAAASAMCGHHHRSSSHSETNLHGKRTRTWSLGCMCGLKPKYLPNNKWGHGFAIVHHAADGFEVRNYEIIDGKVY